MECTHLNDSAKIVYVDPPENLENWTCAGCKTDKSPWVCLLCGVVNCGRYVNGHAKEHWESDCAHTVCMDCESLAVFCYTCDDFVISDTPSHHLDKVRECLVSYRRTEDIEEDVIEEPVPVEDATEKENQDSTKLPIKSSKEEQENSRVLRPRTKKRYNSTGRGNNENRDGKRRKGDRSRGENNNRDKRVVGLRNLGNTCFMNAVLQSLSNIQEFYSYFKELPSLENAFKTSLNGRRSYSTRSSIKEIDDAIVTEELRKIIINLNQGGGTKGAISPESLFNVIWKVVPRFRGYQQQDAHEFLRYMLDRLHTELLLLLPDNTFKDNNYVSLGTKGKSSIVTTIFGGTLQNEVRCLMCGMESKKHDPFLDLSLDIPCQFIINRKPKDELPGPPCSLSDCLHSFVEVEELADTELYYCSNCKKKEKSTKKFWIRRLPNVLCLHIKRFRWSNFYRTKIDTHIDFPQIALDMSKYILTNLHETRRSGTGSNLYDLAAVIVHHGSGAGSGHYTAFATHEGQWYHFNDSTVKPTDASTVAKCKAYILFYIRREFRLPKVTAKS